MNPFLHHSKFAAGDPQGEHHLVPGPFLRHALEALAPVFRAGDQQDDGGGQGDRPAEAERPPGRRHRTDNRSFTVAARQPLHQAGGEAFGRVLPAQGFTQSVIQLAHPTSPKTREAFSRKKSKARESWLFTVPTGMPITAAISSLSRSSWYLKMTRARHFSGSDATN